MDTEGSRGFKLGDGDCRVDYYVQNRKAARTDCRAQGARSNALRRPPREGNPKKGYVCTCGWLAAVSAETNTAL